jgi:hypothetical protein
MKTVFTKLTTRTTTEDPIYISRLQWESAAYIPDEVLNRLVIVDFKEEEDDNRTEDTESK